MAKLAFDVYGTLIDTHGIVTALEPLLGDRAAAFSRSWRDKQLEYSFRRGLMSNYVSFDVCTEQALVYTAALFEVTLDVAQQQRLMSQYLCLPAFADALTGLQQAREAGHQLYAFSNGVPAALDELLAQAGLLPLLDGVISVHELRSFKPDPAVYGWCMRQMQATAAQSWLISGNPFDITGARSAGMSAAWVRRVPGQLFDPWELQPTVIVPSLDTLTDAMC